MFVSCVFLLLLFHHGNVAITGSDGFLNAFVWRGRGFRFCNDIKKKMALMCLPVFCFERVVVVFLVTSLMECGSSIFKVAIVSPRGPQRAYNTYSEEKHQTAPKAVCCSC